jgi:hypothetical protein
MWRFGRPDEIVAAIDLRLLEDAAFDIGQTLHVDGGGQPENRLCGLNFSNMAASAQSGHDRRRPEFRPKGFSLRRCLERGGSSISFNQAKTQSHYTVLQPCIFSIICYFLCSGSECGTRGKS